MKNNVGTFKYFINGVVSTLKNQQQDRQLLQGRQIQLERNKPQRSRWYREMFLQKFFVKEKVWEENKMKKSVYLRKLQIGIKLFWKGKLDYLHTG